MKIFGIHILTSAQVAAIEAFGLTEVQKAVAALKATDIGAAVAADIAALKDSTLTGAEKFDKVVASTLPLVAKFLFEKGSANAALDQIEDIARELVQSIFNDTMSTKAGTIASLILSLLGIK